MTNAANSQGTDPTSPHALLAQWVTAWGTHDLDQIRDVFLDDDRLTYFSSEKEGLLIGHPAMIAHHEGFGFKSGGVDRAKMLWLGSVEIIEFGSTAVIAAIWYFGDPDKPEAAQNGPMSIVAASTADGYRIAHMHFATYK